MTRLGLRTRILLALMATSAVTLAVAALALFSPLQNRLEEQDRKSVTAAALATRPALEEALWRDRGVVGTTTFTLLNQLSVRADARVALYDGIPTELANIGITDKRLTDVYKVIVTDHSVPTVTEDGTGIAMRVVPAITGSRRLSALPAERRFFVLVVRKPTTGGEAVDAVRGAFITAAFAGLGVALVLGLGLSAGLSRRLGRLRRAAMRLAAHGTEAPPPPMDDGADEVGDLARALASMQRALHRQEEARRAFVATASHELRTPLTSLQGNLELLAEDLEGGDVDLSLAREQLATSQGQLRRLANLASELLDLSRLDAGVVLRHEPVELGELCRAVAAEFELRAEERGVDLIVVQPPGPVWASGDPGAVARVARILLDNALRFSPAGEAVRVTAAYHGERATIEVIDRGPGVPVEEGELIFERFQRGSRTGGEGGFGLGLAIGRELAQRLDGELVLETPGGTGARFILRLPIELPRGSGDEDHAGAPVEAPPAS